MHVRLHHGIPSRSLLLVALPAVVALALVVIPRHGSSHAPAAPPAARATPATVAPKVATPRALPLHRAESKLVLRFVKTAVMREHATRASLLEGWKLTGPKLRQGTSLHEWLSGTSSVTPFPQGAIAPHLQVDHSNANDALLELALYPQHAGGVHAGVFLIGLHRYGSGARARWLVDYWAPHGSSSMPSATG